MSDPPDRPSHPAPPSDQAARAAARAEERGRTGDFGEALEHGWADRTAGDAQWDAAALAFTAGETVEVHRRDGTVFRGRVRTQSDGHGWWRVVTRGDAVEFDDGTLLRFDDIVSIATAPDEDHRHDLGPSPHEEG